MYRNPNSAREVRIRRMTQATVNGYKKMHPSSSRNSETPREMYEFHSDYQEYPHCWGAYIRLRRNGLPAWLAYADARPETVIRALGQQRDGPGRGEGLFGDGPRDLPRRSAVL